jgi:hypothetical protein
MYYLTAGSILEDGELPETCVSECSDSGDVSDAVFSWRDEIGFTVSRGEAKQYLKRLGAWDKEELDEMTTQEMAAKVLWLACCEIKENGMFVYD